MLAPPTAPTQSDDRPAPGRDFSAAFPKAARTLKVVEKWGKSETLSHLREFYDIAQDRVGGPWWKKCYPTGGRSATDGQPLSSLGEAIRTYMPHVLGDQVNPIVEPDGIGTRGDSKILELELDRVCDDCDFQEEDEKVVMDSMLGIGIGYVCKREGGQSLMFDGTTVDPGAVGFFRVPIDNFFFDPDCDAWKFSRGEGHWYTVDRQAAIAAGIGDEKLLNKIPNTYDMEQKDAGGRGSSTQSGSRKSNEEEHLDDPIMLGDFCFSYKGKRFCCTLPPTNGPDEYVIEPYELTNEPDGSRYTISALNTMPGSLIPVCPAMVMMDAALAKDAIAAKIVREIEELERKWVAKPGAQPLMMKLMDKSVRGVVYGDPDSFKEAIIGGMVKEAVDAFAFLKALGQSIGPNVDLAGGKEDPSNTATVGSILAGQAAVILGQWRSKIDKYRMKVLRRMAALALQGKDQRVYTFRTSNGMSYPMVFDASTLDISYDQFKYRIKPSNANDSMDARMKLRSLFEIMTALPQMLQFVIGIGGDPQKALRVVSDIAAMPQLDEMLPNADAAAIQQRLMMMMVQRGILTPQGGGQTPGGSGPMNRTSQMQSDYAARVPA